MFIYLVSYLFLYLFTHLVTFPLFLFVCFPTAKSYGWTSWSGWTPCDDDCYRTRERYCYHSGNMQSCGGNVNSYGVETDKQKCPSSICPGNNLGTNFESLQLRVTTTTTTAHQQQEHTNQGLNMVKRRSRWMSTYRFSPCIARVTSAKELGRVPCLKIT